MYDVCSTNLINICIIYTRNWNTTLYDQFKLSLMLFIPSLIILPSQLPPIAGRISSPNLPNKLSDLRQLPKATATSSVHTFESSLRFDFAL